MSLCKCADTSPPECRCPPSFSASFHEPFRAEKDLSHQLQDATSNFLRNAHGAACSLQNLQIVVPGRSGFEVKEFRLAGHRHPDIFVGANTVSLRLVPSHIPGHRLRPIVQG